MKKLKSKRLIKKLEKEEVWKATHGIQEAGTLGLNIDPLGTQ